MLRELVTRFGRHNIGALWLFIEPMIFTLGVAGVWSVARLKHGSTPLVAFAITGYSSVLLWRNSVSHCNGAIRSNLNLLFHRNVRVIDIMLSRVILEIAGATASFFALTTTCAGLGLLDPPKNMLAVVSGWGMLAWFGTGLAITIGSATTFSPIIERLWTPVAYLLFPLSGAAYMADWLTPSVRDTLLWLPMVHSVEYIREGFFGEIVRFHYNMPYMATCNLGLTLTACWLARQAGSRAESS